MLQKQSPNLLQRCPIFIVLLPLRGVRASDRWIIRLFDCLGSFVRLMARGSFFTPNNQRSIFRERARAVGVIKAALCNILF